MNKGEVQRLVVIGLTVFVILSVFIWCNKNMLSWAPWDNTGTIEWSTYAGKNKERTAIVCNSEGSVIVLNSGKEFIYQLDAHPNSTTSFSDAEYTALDELNNLYVFDKHFNGAFAENTERVLKFSSKGKFIEETYAYHYTNEDFIFTKGKICGITYFSGYIYLVRLESIGFYLERASTIQRGEPELIQFFNYPKAFRDLAYCRINAETGILTFTAESRAILQFSFSGGLVSEWPAQSGALPYTAASDTNNNIIYPDIATDELFFLDTATGELTRLFSKPEGSLAYINYTNNTILVSYEDEVLIGNESGEFESINSFTYAASAVNFRLILFALSLLDILVFLVLTGAGIYRISKIKISDFLKSILLVGACIAFGAGIASVFIIHEMNERYYENTYDDLENISRMMAASIDANVLTSITSSAQYDSKEYLQLRNQLKSLLTQLPVKGMTIYQYIWMERDGTVYSMYDSESANGMLFPVFEYEDSYQQEVTESKDYVHTNDMSAVGRWLFACGPIFDDAGNVVAQIETGYNMSMVEEQTGNTIIQTVLIVIATTIAFLLIMIEFMLIMNGYNRNKLDWKIDKRMPFRPELLRAIVFFQFFSANMACALLPMYATSLYQPVFNLPKEFIITFPFTANVIFLVLAQLIIPSILKKTGIKQIGFIGSVLFVLGNILCFAATNVVYLSAGYALIGFSLGALILVVNTIISAQKSVEEVTSGFANYNASYLAGMNVGIVFGSIIAQFFSYRIVFLFAAVFSVFLLIIYAFSIRSIYTRYFYNMTEDEPAALNDQKAGYRKNGGNEKFALAKFIFNPLVLVTLLMVLLPYMASSSFMDYFLPVFATENGLTESNVGQLILLSGLFAILFGTSLCEYLARKLPTRLIVIISLFLNAGALYLFSINVSVPMMIITVIIIAIANIFALTNIQTYYATLYQDTMIPSMKALSLYSMVENIALAIGPVVFAYILRNDIGNGIKLFAAALAVGLVLFVIVSSAGRLPRDTDLNRRKTSSP